MGFVLLFVGVELLDWVLQLGNSQPVGYWTVLGGLGLAAASNARHLPKLSKFEAKGNLADEQGTSTEPPIVSQPKADPPEPKPSNAETANKRSGKGIDRDDSISFRVRLPWR